MAKVFSATKYLANTDRTEILPNDWAAQCVGKEVIDGMIGVFLICDCWCDITPDDSEEPTQGGAADVPD